LGSKAINTVHPQAAPYFQSGLLLILISQAAVLPKQCEELTKREVAVLKKKWRLGLSNKKIAQSMSISVRTVSKHIAKSKELKLNIAYFCWLDQIRIRDQFNLTS